MYFFIEQKDELVRKLNEVLSENDFTVVNDIWDNTNNVLYEKYQMPALWLAEDGYSRGEATDEELIVLADRVKADGRGCYYNNENDETLFKSLDREFISVFSDNIEKEIIKRITVDKETLIEFAKSEDYSYLYGAGLMMANSTEEKAGIASIIDQSSIIEEVIGDISERPCAELIDEQKNGCTIFKCYNSNEEALYIAYFK